MNLSTQRFLPLLALALPAIMLTSAAHAGFQVQVPLGSGCAQGTCSGGGAPAIGANQIVQNDFALYFNLDPDPYANPCCGSTVDAHFYHRSTASETSPVYSTVSGVLSFKGGQAVDFAAVSHVYYTYENAAGTALSPASWYAIPSYAATTNTITMDSNQLSPNYDGAAMADMWSWQTSYAGTSSPEMLSLISAAQSGGTRIRISFRRADGSTVTEQVVPVTPAHLNSVINLNPNGDYWVNRLYLSGKP